MQDSSPHLPGKISIPTRGRSDRYRAALSRPGIGLYLPLPASGELRQLRIRVYTPFVSTPLKRALFRPQDLASRWVPRRSWRDGLSFLLLRASLRNALGISETDSCGRISRNERPKRAHRDCGKRAASAPNLVSMPPNRACHSGPQHFADGSSESPYSNDDQHSAGANESNSPVEMAHRVGCERAYLKQQLSLANRKGLSIKDLPLLGVHPTFALPIADRSSSCLFHPIV